MFNQFVRSIIVTSILFEGRKNDNHETPIIEINQRCLERLVIPQRLAFSGLAYLEIFFTLQESENAIIRSILVASNDPQVKIRSL